MYPTPFLPLSLDLQYVDAISTVRYIMSDAVRDDFSHTPNAQKLSRMGSSTLNLSEIKDPHVALKTELTHILDAKALDLAAAAKGKKKDEGSPGETDYSGEALTEELCAALPGLLVRECILLRINTDPKCIKKGYVLDLWKQFFSNLVEYLEMTLGHELGSGEANAKELSAAATADSAHADGNTPLAAEEQEQPPSPVSKQDSYLAGGTALVVELQVYGALCGRSPRILLPNNDFWRVYCFGRWTTPPYCNGLRHHRASTPQTQSSPRYSLY